MKVLDTRGRGRLLGATAVLALGTHGCAPATPTPAERPADLRVELRRFTQEDGNTEYVSLEPLRIGSAPSIAGDDVVLAVGALYAHGLGHGDAAAYHALALVLRTTSTDGSPIFAADRSLLLSLDGQYVASNPVPGGHAYQVSESPRGLQETVMVPVTPERIRALADATEVRGRLGPWFSFVLPRPHRRALLALLDEIPSDVEYNRGAVETRIVADR
ncbi:MAG: hypothetical protein PVI57_21870 [Gemmatimonadota bacterium]|jgi:hypothetical protein